MMNQFYRRGAEVLGKARLAVFASLHLCGFILCCQAIGAQAADPAALYQQHCASCHGADRLGSVGPALFAENLERLKPAQIVQVITEGRAATQMAGFAGKLEAADIAALAKWVAAPVTPAPAWTDEQMQKSRIGYFPPGSLPDKPVFKADMMNLFVVVESGDHHVSILDGDKLEPIHRFPSRYALHGGPKFTPDGRYVFFASRDGWISKFDIWNLKLVAEIRAGINTRNVAVSEDGNYVMVANYLPRTVVVLDGDLKPVKTLEARSLDGKESSRVSAVYDAAPRKSFVVAMKDIPELWEVSYDPGAPLVFDGLVHDYKMGEGVGRPGFLNPRRTPLDTPLDDFFFDQSYRHIIGAGRQAGKGEVVNLDARRKVATLDLPGMPHLGSGITWPWHDTVVLATPNLRQGVITVVDMKTWQPVAHIPTPGPGFFLRSHENTPYAWTDSMMSPAKKDTLTVLDKESLRVVAELRPEPGKTLAHVEFTRDGRFVLASLWEMKDQGGALIVFDARTFKEVKRIPMNKPVGKYNLFNKITRSAGTSH